MWEVEKQFNQTSQLQAGGGRNNWWLYGQQHGGGEAEPSAGVASDADNKGAAKIGELWMKIFGRPKKAGLKKKAATGHKHAESSRPSKILKKKGKRDSGIATKLVVSLKGIK